MPEGRSFIRSIGYAIVDWRYPAPYPVEEIRPISTIIGMSLSSPTEPPAGAKADSTPTRSQSRNPRIRKVG